MSDARRGAGAARTPGADEGRAHRRALQRSGLDLRAQARRDPLRRDPRRRRGCGCCRATTCRSTTATRRSPRRSTARPRERFAVDGEIVAFDGAQTSFARLAQRGQRARAGLPLRLRPALARRPRRPPRCRCASASGCCATRSTSTTRSASRRTATATARSSSREACRKGWEGLIAKRADCPYTDGALARLAEVQVRAGPGAGDRRLHRRRGASRAELRRAAARLLRRRGRAALRRQGRHRLRRGDAARPRRAAARRCAATTPPFADAARDHASATATWVEPELVAADRLHRVDARRPPAPPALPRAARRQGRARGGARGRRVEAPGATGLTGGPGSGCGGAGSGCGPGSGRGGRGSGISTATGPTWG